ncbi:MAG: hypothetical protein IJ576_01385 [Synergistaceae bacterium]|nr:hypothetical protein [Synergistaceae bacterium]MBR1417599.1 hypothetical protein [Synergistaceae bacterium]
MTSMDAENIFIRKDVFDARMDRLEAIIGEKLTQFRGEMKEEILDIRGDIKAINARIDGLQNGVYWGFAVLGVLLAFTTFAPSFVEFIRNLRKPQISTENIQAMIDDAISKVIEFKKS